MKTSKSMSYKQKCFKNMFVNLKQLCKKLIYFHSLFSGIARKKGMKKEERRFPSFWYFLLFAMNFHILFVTRNVAY